MTKEDWVELGFNNDVAEALFETGQTKAVVAIMTDLEIFDLFLQWNGVIGYSRMFADGLDNIRNMEAVTLGNNLGGTV